MALTVQIQEPDLNSSHPKNVPFTVKAKITGGTAAAVFAKVLQTIGGLEVVLEVRLTDVGAGIWQGVIDPSELTVGDATLKVEALVVDGSVNMAISITASSSSSSSSGPPPPP